MIARPFGESFYLTSRPGYQTYAVAPSGVKLQRIWANNGKTYALSSGTLYGVKEGGLNAIDSVYAEDLQPPDIAIAGEFTAITTASGLYMFDGTAVQEIGVNNGITNVTSVASLQGTFYYSIKDSDIFYYSREPYHPNEIHPLDFALAGSRVDNLVAIRSIGGRLLMIGSESVEIWAPTSNPGVLPVVPVTAEPVLDMGCISRNSIAQSPNAVSFVGNDGEIYLYRGQGFQRITNHSIRQSLRDASDVPYQNHRAFVIEGETRLHVHSVGTQFTAAYDLDTGSWSYYTTSGKTHWDITDATRNQSETLFITDDSYVFRQEPKRYLDNNQTIARRVVTFPLRANEDQMTVRRIRVDTEPGEFGSGDVGEVQLRTSPDGGLSWSELSSRPLGPGGYHNRPLDWLNMGSATSLVADLRITGDTPASISAITVDAEFYGY